MDLSRRRLALILAAVLAAIVGWVGVAALLDSEETKLSDAEFRSFSGPGFTAQLPCTPKQESQSAPVAGGKPVVVTFWICEGGGDAYSVSVTDPGGRPVDLRGAAQGGAQAVSGTVQDLKESTFGGFPAIDFRIPDASKNSDRATVFSRVISAKGSLFQLQYLTSSSGVATPPAAYAAFLAAFALT